jgi:hypothetical protein
LQAVRHQLALLLFPPIPGHFEQPKVWWDGRIGMHGINDGVAVVGSHLPSALGPTPVRQTPVVGDSKEPGPDRGLLLEAGEGLIRRQKDILGDLLHLFWGCAAEHMGTVPHHGVLVPQDEGLHGPLKIADHERRQHLALPRRQVVPLAHTVVLRAEVSATHQARALL